MPSFGISIVRFSTLRLQPWNYLLQIARNLVRQGFSVTLTTFATEIDTKVKESLIKEGIMVQTSFNKHRVRDVLIVPIAVGFLSRIGKLLEHVNKHCEIVGVLTTPLLDIQTLLLNYIKVKMSRTSVTIDAVFYENILFRLFANLICRYVKKFIVPSDDYKEMLLYILPCYMDTIKFVPQVMTTSFEEELKPHSTTEATIAYFGPFSEERGVVSLIKAFRILHDKYKMSVRILLLIRSIGSKRVGLINKLLMKDMNKDGVYLHVGYLNRSDLFNKLAMADLIVLPYRIVPSTIPLAYLEAVMLSGPLVVATNIPGISEHLRNYLPLYIKPTYSVNELGYVLVKLINDQTLLKTSACKQRKYVQGLKQEYSSQKLLL